MRYPVLDALRGVFLALMTVTHVHYVTGAPIGLYTHHSFGFVEDAQGFVFMSGLVVGLVYTQRLLRRGEAAMTAALRTRMREIYLHQALLIAAIGALALRVTPAMPAWEALEAYAADPGVYAAASLALLAAPAFADILPMYLVFMLATPLLLRAFTAGKARQAALGSALLWAAGQTAAPELATLALQRALGAAGAEAPLGVHFNVFAWQAIYVGGLWAGHRLAQGRLDLSPLRSPAAARMAAAAALLFLGFGALDQAMLRDLLPRDLTAALLPLTDRTDLALVQALNFAVDLYLVAWLLTAGARSRSAIARTAARALSWLASRRALILLGQHSLPVYTTHALIVWAIFYSIPTAPLPALDGTVLTLLAVGALWIVAGARAAVRRRRSQAAA